MAEVCAEDGGFAVEYPARPHDVDAAHARLRSHQASLDYINSRVDGNERRIDRIEKRMDDQSAILNEIGVIARTTQAEVKNNGQTSRHTADRVEKLISRLSEHAVDEAREQQAQTTQMERLHRTIIRGVTLLAVIAVLLIAAFNENQIFDFLLSVLGG